MKVILRKEFYCIHAIKFLSQNFLGVVYRRTMISTWQPCLMVWHDLRSLATPSQRELSGKWRWLVVGGLSGYPPLDCHGRQIPDELSFPAVATSCSFLFLFQYSWGPFSCARTTVRVIWGWIKEMVRGEPYLSCSRSWRQLGKNTERPPPRLSKHKISIPLAHLNLLHSTVLKFPEETWNNSFKFKNTSIYLFFWANFLEN